VRASRTASSDRAQAHSVAVHRSLERNNSDGIDNDNGEIYTALLVLWAFAGCSKLGVLLNR